MPYKDAEKQKEANRKAMQLSRVSQKRAEGITLTGEERIKYIQNLLGTYLTEEIEKAVKWDVLHQRPLSREDRYESALRYKEWKENREGK